MKSLNLKLNKLKFAIKNTTEIILKLSKYMIGTNETNVTNSLLLQMIHRQI